MHSVPSNEAFEPNSSLRIFGRRAPATNEGAFKDLSVEDQRGHPKGDFQQLNACANREDFDDADIFAELTAHLA